MGLGQLQPITPPPNRQPTTGLLAVANRPTDVPDEWVGGFGYDPEACGDALLLSIECGTGSDKTPEANPASVEYAPAAIVYADACSTLSRGRDGAGRAARGLLQYESKALERLLWTGVATGDDTTDERPHLADGRATVLGGSGVTPLALVIGLALLDQALTECLGGVQGMVHVTPLALSHAVPATWAVRDGNRWLTPNGHLIVAGAGYTGGGPRPTVGGALPAAPDLLAGVPANQWAYGTPYVNVLLSPPTSQTDVDRAVNTERTIKERAGAAFYGACCQYAVQLDLTP